jgi:ubiquinone/menaquinone biosynthesis C-methylase UbiE
MSKESSIALLAAATTLPFSQSEAIIDIGCGRGGIIDALLSTYDTAIQPDIHITDIGASPGMIDQIKQRLIQDYPSWAHVQTEVLDTKNLSTLEDSSFNHVLSGFTLYFLPPEALQEAYRITAPGGILATNSMASVSWWEMYSTISLIKPEFKLPDLPKMWFTVAAMT